jgi:peroxiredoxin Q/BCP
MSGKKAKAARRAASLSAQKAEARSAAGWRSWKGGLVALGVVAVVAASFVLPGVFEKEPASAGAQHAMATGGAPGEGLPAGSAVPAFSERDLLSGQTVSSQSVYGRKTLLFFSEGVMCQACFEQIRGIEQFGAELRKRGINLISITPDSPADLEQAAGQYGITTPLIADDDRNMSDAFNTLGKGMHADTPGHAFALIDRGKVLWYRDYWLPPDRTMYVKPAKLLADIPA